MLLSEYSYLIPDIRGQYGYLEYQYFWVKTSAANELISATQNKLTNHNTNCSTIITIMSVLIHIEKSRNCCLDKIRAPQCSSNELSLIETNASRYIHQVMEISPRTSDIWKFKTLWWCFFKLLGNKDKYENLQRELSK